MTLWQNLWRKLAPDHGGLIEWTEDCDVPPQASRPAPLEPERDESLWVEFLGLSKPDAKKR